MGHYAKVVDGIVEQVIVAQKDFIDTLEDSASWLKASYNTRGGVHYAPNSETPDDGIPLRKNFPSIGYHYDTEADAFYAPQPFKGWVLHSDEFIWYPPIPHPEDGNNWEWDENLETWVQVPEPQETAG